MEIIDSIAEFIETEKGDLLVARNIESYKVKAAKAGATTLFCYIEAKTISGDKHEIYSAKTKEECYEALGKLVRRRGADKL